MNKSELISQEYKNLEEHEYIQNEVSLPSSKDLLMYTLPEEQPPTQEDIKVYRETKERIVNDIPALIKGYLLKKDIRVALEIAALVPYAPTNSKTILYSQVSYIVSEGLKFDNSNIQLQAAKLIQYLPEGAQMGLRTTLSDVISQMMEYGNSYDQAKAAEMIQYTDENAQKDLRKLLAPIIFSKWHNDFTTERQNALCMFVPNLDNLYDTTIDMIKEGLKDRNAGVRQNAAYIIQFAPENLRAGVIKEALKDNVDEVRMNAVAMIQFVPENSREELIRDVWKNKNIKREEMVEIMYYAPKDIQEKLWGDWYAELPGNVQETELELLAQSTPLYKNAPDKFFRHNFAKTGSKTTLLGTVPAKPEIDFKEKVIVRHIDTSAYANWAKAFESYTFWKTHKFNYVPVEPIVRARLETTTGKVAVFAKVLGPSIARWQAKTPLFREEIKEQADRIVGGLKELEINHGHPHAGNFCLVFHRTPNGAADIKRPPLVYIIDFDEATSTFNNAK